MSAPPPPINSRHPGVSRPAYLLPILTLPVAMSPPSAEICGFFDLMRVPAVAGLCSVGKHCSNTGSSSPGELVVRPREPTRPVSARDAARAGRFLEDYCRTSSALPLLGMSLSRQGVIATGVNCFTHFGIGVGRRQSNGHGSVLFRI